MGYFLRRLSFYLVALLVAATLNFIIPRAMPGDPVTMMFANASVQVTPERIAAMKELLGFVDDGGKPKITIRKTKNKNNIQRFNVRFGGIWRDLVRRES